MKINWNEEGWTDVNCKIVQNKEEVNYWGKPFAEEGEDLFQIWLPYFVFEESFNFPEPHQHIQEYKDWQELPVFPLSRLEFLELLPYDGIKGNLGNIYWEENTLTDAEWRRKIYFGDLKAK
ncbi:hypothetical protein O181_074964 [Austropuccinia psidii MF-1]|uniref:Uncharacterized protein n=1 Tax=Austropuccinia psidii MF-1 TaxID=1389203 RepID=A0A9Q3FA33_9BASI|nr:hypothetical protein [Austropuccinia psidii MF-1]